MLYKTSPLTIKSKGWTIIDNELYCVFNGVVVKVEPPEYTIVPEAFHRVSLNENLNNEVFIDLEIAKAKLGEFNNLWE